MFFKKIKIFSITLFIILLCCFFLNKIIVDKLFADEAVLPSEAKWLAIGDSHITNSINPEKYPWLINRAHSGERLPYNLEKIKFYINNNPQIELVILGYWYNTMLYNKDWVLYGKDSQYRYESYLPIQLLNKTDVSYLNVPKNRKLFWENYWGFKVGYPSPAIKLAVKNYFTFNTNLEMRGGFLKAKQVYIKKESKHKKDTTSMIIDSLAQKNLKDIVTFLKEKKIKLVFLNTPVREEFLSPLNESNIRLMNSFTTSYANNKNVWYLNFSNIVLEDKYFNDLHHLNIDGANYFTPIVLDSIKKLTKSKRLVIK